MSLRSRLMAAVQHGDPAGTFTNAWLASVLEQERDDLPGQAISQPTASVDLTVPEVAALFGRGVSTVRSWIAEGHLEGCYRLNRREWRVPRSAVEAMQERQRAGDRGSSPKQGPSVPNVVEWPSDRRKAAR